jgi:hypothetical protein
MKDSGQTAASTPQPPSKKTYEQPQLVRHGTVRELTAAGAVKPFANDVVSIAI